MKNPMMIAVNLDSGVLDISKKYPKDIITIFKITIRKVVYMSLTPDKIQ